ncbi:MULTISPECIES: Fur family transcriptional regulator [Nesterenkonia]|uniref:Fur family ferric uptake transcriptional regulator n=1 Tax=Nesterenkonia xinjiangensis TaxID=225327 RepID=A0A7Z0GJQ1_9MICC|nr:MULTISPECIES: transcriptional repressor [Nesterenkonia]MDZ5076684.1 transcriptional repressor [Nesterenkonia sp. HG001]NYJ77230.1 Fur family ferric uptake transcriptional regulator [Nesterenkonia xinjiangensis]
MSGIGATSSHHALHGGGGQRRIEEALARLRQSGERHTEARRAVLQVLAGGHEHLSADELAVQLAASGVHRTTVYRTLELFSALGLVAVRRLPGGAAAYHLASTSHLHGHCDSCDAVQALPRQDAEELAAALERSAGFRLDLDRSTLLGRCAGCRVD